MIFEQISNDRARALMGHMSGVKKWDTSDGLASFDEVVFGGVAFVAVEDGRELMVFIIQKIDRAHGKELIIKAAWQLVKDGGLTERIAPLIGHQFGQDCDAVMLQTRRPGLIRKLKTVGFYEAGTIIRMMIKK